jgi:hypothetical protein
MRLVILKQFNTFEVLILRKETIRYAICWYCCTLIWWREKYRIQAL